MTLSFGILLLILQADLIASECNVDNCDVGHCNGVTCSQCLPGYYKHLSGHCYKCYLFCKHCNGGQCYTCHPSNCLTDICSYANCDTAGCSANHNAACSGCPDGFYMKDNFCFRCNNVNCKCASALGCFECLPGHYDLSKNCNNNCPTNCLICDSLTHCYECIPGKYGRSCQHSCISTCENGTCDKESGICLGGCGSGEYLESGVCKVCPQRCFSCVNSTYCTKCNQIYNWNPTCAYDCNGCIDKCNIKDGCSAGCSDLRYYNIYNEHKKGYECFRCFDRCLTCENDTYCTSCENNYWGRQCRYKCNHCNGTCDIEYGCATNCKLGYYRENIDTGYECKPCVMNCEQCLDSSKCIVCEEGYYVDDERYNCITCPTGCKDNICDRSNGTCTRGCSIGKTGYHCNEICPNICGECNQFNSSKCYSCKSGFYGYNCENSCSQNCKTADGIHECLKQDGTCIFGCEVGHWTKTCTETCFDGCIDQACNENSGLCLHGCESGHYGANCSLRCPEYCFGGKCFQDNGTCVFVCISGSTDSRCIDVSDSSFTQAQNANLDSKNAVIVGLAVAVGILGIVAISSTTGIIIIMWKSRKTIHSSPRRCHDEDRELADRCPAATSARTSSDVVGYEDLTSVRSEEKMYSTITNEYENTNLSL